MAKKKNKRPSVVGKRVAVPDARQVASREKGEVAASGAPEERPSAKAAETSLPSASEGVPSTSAPLSRTGTPRVGARERQIRRRRMSRRFFVVAGVFMAVLLVATAALAWNHWLRYDDAADIQGSWKIDGSEQVITITSDQIALTPEVSYSYTLDTFAKTIDFTFEQYGGSGSYAFSPERTTLVITETQAESGQKVSTKLVKQ